MPLFQRLIDSMFAEDHWVPDDFNIAYLLCIPKNEGVSIENFDNVLKCVDTRPLSIVNTYNRILAALLQKPVERWACANVTLVQRGFVPGRSMVRNILDIDHFSQLTSMNTNTGVIMLFDFKAAFPSISHDFIWQVLSYLGFPWSSYPSNSKTLFQ